MQIDRGGEQYPRGFRTRFRAEQRTNALDQGRVPSGTKRRTARHADRAQRTRARQKPASRACRPVGDLHRWQPYSLHRYCRPHVVAGEEPNLLVESELCDDVVDARRVGHGCILTRFVARGKARSPTLTFETLEVSRTDAVGWLVFNRPQAANAMDATMLDELEAAWLQLEADDAVRVIVNTGNGVAFQTGLDIVQLAKSPGALREQSRRTKRAELKFTAWHNGVTKPVIAAINGVCAGGGLHFVADADIVIASDTASFLDPHVSVGQVSAFETIGLSKRMPIEAVMRMALMGAHERVGAVRALQLGMVSEVVTNDVLRERAQTLAALISQQEPSSLRTIKAQLWNALERP